MSAAEPVGSATRSASSGAASADALSAPLFHSLVDRLGDGGRFVVLDLAAAKPATVRLLSQFRCRYEVAELADSVDLLNTAAFVRVEDGPERDDYIEVESRVLADVRALGIPAPRVFAVDASRQRVPFAWQVMECIASRGRRCTLVHALLYCAARRMPERPSSFLPVDDQRIEIMPPSDAQRDAPRYSPEDLASCMPRYAVDRARLLRNGMQEYLFLL